MFDPFEQLSHIKLNLRAYLHGGEGPQVGEVIC